MRFFLLLFVIGTPCFSEDFGVHGHTFEIQEPDLLDQIEGRLKALENSGDLARHQKTLIEKAKVSLKRPTPVVGLAATKAPRLFYYDPSISVPSDLKDHMGKIFQKAGSHVNPLTQKSLTNPLLFIDGDDEKQVSWAAQHNKKAKIILVKGAPFTLMERFERPFFFDQNGVLSKKLKLKQIPARVTQDGLLLKIEEVLMEGQR